MLPSLCKLPLPRLYVSRTLHAFKEDEARRSFFRSHIGMTVDDPFDPVQKVVDARIDSRFVSGTRLSVVVVFLIAE